MRSREFIFIICLLSNLNIAYHAFSQETTVSYKKPLFDFNSSKSSFLLDKNQYTNVSGMLRYSLLTGYREGVEPIKGFINVGSSIDRNNGTIRLYMYNLSIQDMLTHGFGNPYQVSLEVKNPSKYRYDSSQGSKLEWMRKNAYCFEYVIPFGISNDNFKLMEDELSRIFHLKKYQERRRILVLVLYRTSKKDKLKTKGFGDSKYDLYGYFNNVEISDGRFGHALSLIDMPPVIDETNYKGRVDMDLKIKSWYDLEEIRKALNKYDLDLKKEYREINTVVIKEIE